MTQPAAQPVPAAAPMQWRFTAATTDTGVPLVIIEAHQGEASVQLRVPAIDAERIAAALVKEARQAQTGLILPGGPLASPNGNGHGH